MDKGQFLLYQTPDGESKIEVKLQDDTVWLSLDQMAELFQRNKSTISRHIKNVLEEGELDENMVVAKFATTTKHGAIEGKTQEHLVSYYNLDMIISVGYRVHSYRGVQFRIWATKVLKEYIVKGDAQKDFMGLTTWSGAMPTKPEAEIAKNYLTQDEIKSLNRIVSLYLDFAEMQAEEHRPMYMKDWINILDDFLRISRKDILTHAGKISAKLAKEKADTEYDKFKERTKNDLSPVEIHFLENFERERKRLSDDRDKADS